MNQTNRNEVPEEHTWDLSPLYREAKDWNSDYTDLETKIQSIPTYRGRLSESASTLREAFETYLETSRLLEKVYVYAHLRSDEDTANGENLASLQLAVNLATRFQAASSYITPEVLGIEDSRLNEFMNSPELTDFKRALLEIIRYKPHTLSAEQENLLAMGSEVFGACGQVFSQLNNADLNFGNLEVEGKQTPLTHGSFIVFLKSRERSLRARAFEQYYGVFEAHKNTIAATLSGAVKKDVYLARAKNFSSAISRALFADNVATKVYDNLIDTVSEHLEPLHEYYRYRKQTLELSEQQIYDTYVPIVPNVETEISFEEASSLVVDSLAPLGEEYTQTLKAGLGRERWVDRYENKGKRSGAYSSGGYDSKPYILMNYKDTVLNDVFTLTHEAGHSMHSYYSAREQLYQDYSYTIFVAEVASTFNEQLLLVHLKELYKNDKRMLAYLINQQIDDIKATLYRQTMFAEFEKTIHEIVEANKALTIDVYRQTYGELLSKYFGDSVVLHELAPLECLRIPHFYSAFYVYKYATGLSAAISLARQVLTGGESERNRYLNFLKAGCSKHPIDLLKDAGVDMTSPEPIAQALKIFDSLVKELRELDLKDL